LRLHPGLLVFVWLLLRLNISHAEGAAPSPAQLPTPLVKLTMIVTDQQHHSVDDARQEEIELEEDHAQPSVQKAAGKKNNDQ